MNQASMSSIAILLATKYAPLRPRSIYLHTTSGISDMTWATSGCLTLNCSRKSTPFIFEIAEFVTLPTR